MEDPSSLEAYLREAPIDLYGHFAVTGGGGHPSKQLVVVRGGIGALAKLVPSVVRARKPMEAPVAFHVDLVKNDWLAGIQYPLATFKLEDGSGEVTVDAPQPGQWQGLLEDINAQADVRHALIDLHTKFHGSHLFATEGHSETDCPFHGRPVYLHGEEASGSASAIPAGA